jgi:hypothetical protein
MKVEFDCRVSDINRAVEIVEFGRARVVWAVEFVGKIILKATE